ncbi:MAG: rod shape-determining protein MreC [Porticoccaceae bacterium]
MRGGDIKNIFRKSSSNTGRVLVLSLVAICLIFVSHYTGWLQPVRGQLAEFSKPFYWITNIPDRLAEWGSQTVVSRAQLEAENERLRTELLVQQGRVQRMAALATENVRLRNLLNATELLSDSVLVTELIGVSSDPAQQTILINRGSNDQVYPGQPVLDADGLMGQVVEVYSDHSRVLLITDEHHALPVQLLRNGVRSIAEGTGDYGRLRLRFVTPTTDVRVGDELISSGLGGRYPPNYPVGRVSAVKKSQEDTYLEVAVVPAARLDRSRHLLLIFSEVDRLGD